MKNTVEEEAKHILEKEGFCSRCGFNSGKNVASLSRDCLDNDCKQLNRKIIQLEPYFKVKTGGV